MSRTLLKLGAREKELFDLRYCNIDLGWTWCTEFPLNFTISISRAIGSRTVDRSSGETWQTTVYLALTTRILKEKLSEFAGITFISSTAVSSDNETVWRFWTSALRYILVFETRSSSDLVLEMIETSRIEMNRSLTTNDLSVETLLARYFLFHVYVLFRLHYLYLIVQLLMIEIQR